MAPIARAAARPAGARRRSQARLLLERRSRAASYGWPVGATYGYLPAGCSYNYIVGQVYYSCGAGWLQPAYGANGLYYRVVPAP